MEANSTHQPTVRLPIAEDNLYRPRILLVDCIAFWHDPPTIEGRSLLPGPPPKALSALAENAAPEMSWNLLWARSPALRLTK